MLVSRKASLPLPAAQAGHLAFALQIRQNHGLQNIALLLSLKARTRQKLLCPCQRSGPPLFCLILAEAVLLTVNKKKRWPVIAAGRAYGGNAGLAFAMYGARKKRKEPAGRVEASL